MDPFEKLPEEIHEDLLKFFTAKEALEVVSLVSKSWYNLVATSATCMQKIKLNLKSRRKNYFEERIETIKWMCRKDGRGYRHLQLNCLLDEENTNEVWSLLESLGGTVETINLRSMKLDRNLRPLSLPNLEELKMMFVPREAMNYLLSSSKNFRVLTLRNEFPLCYDGIDYTPNESTILSIKRLIKNNEKLVELELQGRPNFFSFFHEDLSELVSFHLKQLVVKIEMSADKTSEAHEANLIKFLSHQASSLQHLYIDLCGTNVIKHAFNAMPELRFLRFEIELREPNKFSVKDLELQPNEKIKHLELPYIVLFDDLKEFLDLTPNVEEILIGHMNPRVLTYVSKNLPKLKSLVYRYDDCAGGCERCYLQMIGDDDSINKDIKMSMCNDFL